MRGSHDIEVRANKLHYHLTINRNITVIQGDSATGKTQLIELIAAHQELGAASGVSLSCDVPVHVLSGRYWKHEMAEAQNTIFFIEEFDRFYRSVEFAQTAKASSNYYVIITRDPVPTLPYSVDEIYGFTNGETANRYPVARPLYTEMHHIYGESLLTGRKPELVIVEDSNSGFEFFGALCRKNGVKCISAQGKTRIFATASRAPEGSILVIADGAAIGSEMRDLWSLRRRKNVELFLPESFEWLVLNSPLFHDPGIQEMLSHPADYIESSEFFSWERFFTRKLIEVTSGTALTYSKTSLNPKYLIDENMTAITEAIPKQTGLHQAPNGQLE